MNARAIAQIDEEPEFEEIESELCSKIETPIGVQFDAKAQIANEHHERHGEQIEAQPAARSERNDAQSEEKARRWMWGFLIALAAMQTYFVQEMLAALFLFTLAFAVFAVIAFAFYLANRASQASLERVEPIARVAARAGRRGYGFVEHISKRPFRRPHSETAQ
jgi:Mg2+/citrate symporter